MPQTIKELISSARHMNAEVEYNKAEVQQALHFCLPSDIDAVWYNIFIKFVKKTPQRYWDPEAVLLALHILLKDPARTVSAINNWRSELEAGCVLYFLPSSVSNDEKPLGGMNVKDILRLSTQFHPEYLNYCEHIFKNLSLVSPIFHSPLEAHCA